MGSTASKATRAGRKYPTQIPTITNKPSTRLPSGHTLGPTIHPRTSSRDTRDAAINQDASDPDFTTHSNQRLNAFLRTLGPVQPSPTLSTTSTYDSNVSNPSYPSGTSQLSDPHGLPIGHASAFSANSTNPQLMMLQARSRLGKEAEREFEQMAIDGAAEGGRRFLDIGMVGSVVRMMEKGDRPEDIEKRLGLERGLVGSLGRGVVSAEGSR